MIRTFVTKYKWYLVAMVCLYVVITVWLVFLTDSPQSLPFEYEVN
jgi:hypothetical protein